MFRKFHLKRKNKMKININRKNQLNSFAKNVYGAFYLKNMIDLKLKILNQYQKKGFLRYKVGKNLVFKNS